MSDQSKGSSASERLHVGEMLCLKGSWHGTVFENPHTDFPLSLIWAFTFEFEEIGREWGACTPNIMVEWVPGRKSPSEMEVPKMVSCDQFADPVESSVYFFQHFRFERVRMSVSLLPSFLLDATVQLEGDLGGLGLDTVAAQARLSFEGVFVQPHVKPNTISDAQSLLATFMPCSDWFGVDRGHNYLFRPSL